MALRHPVSAFTQMAAAHPDKTLHVTRPMISTPALLARFLERQAEWQAEITGILAGRTGLDPHADLRPPLAAGVALTALQVALRRWADADGGEGLAGLVDQAFSVVAPALDACGAR